jgi:hypothetical protein
MPRSSTEWFIVEDTASATRRIAARLHWWFWLITSGCALAALGIILAVLVG